MSKSHLEIVNVFFNFQNKSSKRSVCVCVVGGGVGGQVGSLALWEMSQTTSSCVFLHPGARRHPKKVPTPALQWGWLPVLLPTPQPGLVCLHSFALRLAPSPADLTACSAG